MNLFRSMSYKRLSSDRIVPPSGHTVHLTVFASAAMAFLAVFALALSFSAYRLAKNWGNELAQTSTVRIVAPEDQTATQVAATLTVLNTTAGVESARALTTDEQKTLLAPWFGPDLPLDTLPIPKLIEIIETPSGYDTTGLRARLQAEAPGAILDTHERWKEPLKTSSQRLAFLGFLSLLLITATTATIVTLAAQASLAANNQVIRVMRLIGAQDSYIASAFVRRFTVRSFSGACLGSLVGLIVIWLLPSAEKAGNVFGNVGFSGSLWLWPCLIPPFSATIAFIATQFAAKRNLSEQA